ncbi:DUF4147 domain-containing protein [Candidatus Parcubacteria bacterium]|jgi:glycerate-2-kinase|nr:MAG: DUF4147 domain-containing protein [Candidatus Parcubacteria bacterium]
MGRIQNFEDLNKSEIRNAALTILESAYNSIDTEEVVKKMISVVRNILLIGETKIPLDSVDRIFVVGAGKCSPKAACAVEKILGERITGGIVLGTKKRDLCSLTMREGTHPYPSEANISATKELLEILHGLTPRDLVIALVSGGGSTLLCNPQNMTCQAERDIVQAMFEKGATINELNTIRKHISGARGGMLAYHAYPARIVSLIFSDVPGNTGMDMVASGPTILDPTTVSDAMVIIKKYNLEHYFPDGSLIETVKDEKFFERVTNILAVSNDNALRTMKKTAESLGFSSSIITNTLSGEARVIGKEIVEKIKNAPSKTAYFWGGEPTVTITQKGKGGRELELVLSAVPHVDEHVLIVGAASDGRDNSDFAGAICDIMTLKNAQAKNIDPIKSLKENTSYKFFETVGDFILTGETGENVSDLIFALKQ